MTEDSVKTQVINKCIKVTLIKSLNINIKEVKQIIRDMCYDSCKASNKAIRMYLFHAQDMIEKKNKDKNFNQKAYEKEKYGKTYRNVIVDEMKKLMPFSNTGNVDTLQQQLVLSDWNRLKKDILSCKCNLPNYKINLPFFIKNSNYKLRSFNGYFVDISFFSKKGLEKYGYKIGHKFEFQIDKLDNNKKATINKIIEGKYKQGSAQIAISKKGKIELIISYSFEKDCNEILLDKNKILGIDLGITNVAVMSVLDTASNRYDYFSWKTNVISGRELIAFRQKYYNIRRDLSISSKWCGEGRLGRGYKTRMKKVNNIRNRVANFSDTYNHKISKYIIDFALKHKCAKIQMEDLKGATANTNEKFLKEWSYYDLQQKIEYKAKENNIEVLKVNPSYTSKRCNRCGCIDDKNRDCKNNQERFKCVICGHTDNADVNASKNIAIPDIDKIIKDYLSINKIRN
ncbi:transposase [Clostridium sp.]|jgi:putative transposase|uniref:transposase n=2 Tax=Clostridium sp. TaxID=1506 RepID=UPI0025BA5025|nr:transposase [Clostridium sp.]MCI9069957.1 IS200/IS605 family element transposase accessory protein TnpB [Clostridium sp.]